MDELFGRYCYIDTPWIAGERTRYRILGSGVRSNAWCEVPVTGRTELVCHDNQEEVVFVVLDTLVSDDSIIRRFALKDVEVIPADVRPVMAEAYEAEATKLRWISVTERLPSDGVYVLAYSADDDYMCVEAKHKFAAFQITHWMPLPMPPKQEVIDEVERAVLEE